MPVRWLDWFRQAERDLNHVRHSIDAGDHEWACFAAQQTAEKAAKAVLQRHNAEAWGHSVLALLKALPNEAPLSGELADAAKALDKHYIQTRYPNGFAEGTPGDYYTETDARKALHDAETIVRFCEGLLRG